MTSPVTAILSPTSHLQGTLSIKTQALFVGQTSITATFTGYPMKSLIDAAIVEDMNACVLVGANTIPDLDQVIVAENIDITTIHSLDELLDHENLLSFSDVDISTDTGLFLFGFPEGAIELQSKIPYAISSSMNFEITQGTPTPVFLVITTKPMTLQFSGSQAVLTALSNTSTITIQKKDGTTLWSGNSQKNYLIIQDITFSITQEPPLFLYPLNPQTSHNNLHLSLAPADPTQINIPQLMENVTIAAAQFGQFNISDIMTNIHDFESIMSTASLVANGAMVLLQTNDTVAVDQSPQKFSRLGFARFSILEVTYAPATSGLMIEGDCKLIFLGTHFYNAQAKNNADGITFPFELLILWIVALCVYMYIRFFLRPDINEDKDTMIKRYALIFHAIMLLIVFILLDREISYQFGISALDALSSQGLSLTTGSFFALEVTLWMIGYAVLAFPIQILTRSGLRLIGIGKGGKGIGKGVGDLFIWVFCALYLQLMINILLSLFHLNTLFAMG